MLLVDNDVDVLKVRSQHLKQEGWSVASYTFAKLEALAASGALFVQHLKSECRISVDRHGRLGALLEHFQPKPSYAEELLCNRDLSGLVSASPDCPRGTLWAADVLYVSVRNFAVLRLASEGIYEFDYNNLIDALASRNVIRQPGVKALRELRFLKCIYRSGDILSESRVLRSLDAALSALPSEDFPSRLKRVPAAHLLQRKGPCSSAAKYVTLRDLERRMLAYASIAPSGTCDPLLARLQTWVRDPRVYAYYASKCAPEIIEQLRTNLLAGHYAAPAGVAISSR